MFSGYGLFLLGNCLELLGSLFCLTGVFIFVIWALVQVRLWCNVLFIYLYLGSVRINGFSGLLDGYLPFLLCSVWSSEVMDLIVLCVVFTWGVLEGMGFLFCLMRIFHFVM